MSKFLNSDGVKYLWGKIKEFVISKVPTKVSQLTNDSNTSPWRRCPKARCPRMSAASFQTSRASRLFPDISRPGNLLSAVR